MKVVISAGHAKAVQGAVGYLNEYDENVRVVKRVSELLGDFGVKVETFVDTVSTTQNNNLKRIVGFHNAEERDLDVSIHFNSYETTNSPMGTECLYLTQDALAQKVATEISLASGLKNRGPKKRTDLYFLNKTEEPAILIEVCFVDSRPDAEIYDAQFEEICAAIAQTISGKSQPDGTFHTRGKASTFGGPDDTGVSPSEGLAFITSIDQAPYLFLPFQPTGTAGLARRLNPFVHYVACRWDYSKTPKSSLIGKPATVKATKTGITLKAFPADWGPNENTGRVADLSPSLMDDLGIQTNDVVEVTFPI
jgi:hypothetical protein